MRIRTITGVIISLLMGCFAGHPASADLTDGLVAYYPFNGNANDESGNGHDGIVHGATLTTDRWRIADSAYSFNGSDNDIEIPYSADMEPSVFSISVWIKTTDNTARILGTYQGYGHCSHGYTLYLLGEPYSGKVDFAVDRSASCGSDTSQVISDSIVAGGEWHHVVAIFDSSLTLSLYVDGIPQSGSDSGAYVKTGLSLLLGRYRLSTDPTYSFEGSLDDLRIYNRALTEPEIEQLFFLDSDGDGVEDPEDNCTEAANPSQLDTDGDDYGNACDCDFDQNLACNIADFTIFREDFIATADRGVGTDMDCNGAVSIADFSLFREGFVAGVPGPSGLVP
jgi:hypothetical protein